MLAITEKRSVTDLLARGPNILIDYKIAPNKNGGPNRIKFILFVSFSQETLR